MRSGPPAAEASPSGDDWLSLDAAGLRLALRVTPRARRPGVGGLAPGRDGRPRLKVGVTAAPEDGAANTEVIALLARTARLPKSAFSLIAGATDRDKVVRIAGTPESLLHRFIALGDRGS